MIDQNESDDDDNNSLQIGVRSHVRNQRLTNEVVSLRGYSEDEAEEEYNFNPFFHRHLTMSTS